MAVIRKIVGYGVLSPTSLYARHFPISKGKGVLCSLASKMVLGRCITNLTACSEDHLKFLLHFPQDRGRESIYFYRNFETGTTNLFKDILRAGDIVFDIGANIGWYTLLFAKYIIDGQCHAFEPVPWIYAKLEANCSLNRVGGNLCLNQKAVGNANRIVQLHTFSMLPHGHSSISTLGRDDFTITEARMITLNEYIKAKNIERVDLIKCDIEGAELEVLEGSSDLFSLKVPPMWLVEMNEQTSRAFGYAPVDLLKFLRQFYDYEFYRIKGAWGKVVPMKTPYDYKHGDNVFAFVPQFHKHRLVNIR